MVEHPDPGEVVWCDSAGVTCRRWNWRQASRTQLRDDTTTALFILDALDPMTDKELQAAGDDLADHLTRLGPDVRMARRLLTADPAPVRESCQASISGCCGAGSSRSICSSLSARPAPSEE